MALRRPDRNGDTGEPVGALGRAEVLEFWPAVVEFLTLTTYDDGSARQLPTLLVFAEDGRWRLWLNDRDNGRSAWADGETLETAFEALEKGLKDDSLSWRRSVPRKKRGT